MWRGRQHQDALQRGPPQRPPELPSPHPNPNPHPHPDPNPNPHPNPNPGQVEIFNGRLHPSGALGPSAPGQTLWNYGTGAAQTALFPVHGFGGGEGWG